MRNSEVSWKEWLAFLSPGGQDAIIDFVHEAKETRGAGWLDEIKAEFPFCSWIIELVATKTDDEALAEIEATYPGWPIRLLAGDKVKSLHARLLAEIERKR